MSDTKPSQTAAQGPAYFDTKQMPAVKVPQSAMDALLSEVRAVRSEQRETRTELKQDIQLVATKQDLLDQRVTLLERQQDEKNKSDSARGRSWTENDLAHEKAIANLAERLNAVEENQKESAKERAKTAQNVEEIKNAVVKTATGLAAFFEDPKVKLVGRVIFAAAMTYAAAKGFKVVP